MHSKPLNEYYRLMKLVQRSEEILIGLREASVPGAQNLSGGPHGSGVSDKVGNFAVEIADLSQSIKKMRSELRALEPEVTQILESIDNDWIRMIARLRFVRGLTWAEVAGAIGGGNTEAGVKQAFRRYDPQKP